MSTATAGVPSVLGSGNPSDREQGPWYFQRHVQQLPRASEMVMFDRTWYNRADVERVTIKSKGKKRGRINAFR